MQNADLLWVNVDPESRRLSKSRPEDKFLINSHIQRYRKRTEQASKHRALRSGSAAKAVVGWATRVTSSDVPVAPPKPSCKTSHKQPTPMIAVASQKHREDQTTLVRSICGRGEAVDPFYCTVAKLKSDGFDLLQFYMAWARPISSQRQSYGSIGNVMDSQVVTIVSRSVSDELRSHTLLSYAAALMEHLGVGGNLQSKGAIHHQFALEMLRTRIQGDASTAQTLLYDICMLCRAAVYRNDEYGALTHIQAVKQIVDETGGFQALDSMVIKYVVFTDRRLAYARMAAPLFTVSQQMNALNIPHSTAAKSTSPTPAETGEPSKVPPEQWHANPSLKQMAKGLLIKLDKLPIPEYLCELYNEILLCAQVLGSISTNSSSSLNASWLTAKHLSISTRLLSMSFEGEGDLQLRGRLESMRATLMLWDHLLTASMAKGRARNVLQIVGQATLEAKKRVWPPRIYEGFQNWNRVLTKSPLKLAANDSRLFLQVLDVVRQMETDDEVPLGDFMSRLYELEQMHQDREMPVALISLRSMQPVS